MKWSLAIAAVIAGLSGSVPVTGIAKVPASPDPSSGSAVLHRVQTGGISTAAFAGPDTEVIAQASRAARASGARTVIVHDRGRPWSLTRPVLDGDIFYRAEKTGTLLSIDAPMPHFMRQAPDQDGGGLSGFEIAGNDNWTNIGIRIGGSNYVIENSEIHDATPRKHYVLIDIEDTAQSPRIRNNSLRTASTLVRVRAAAADVLIENNWNLSDFRIKGINILSSAGERGPWVIRGNTFNAPANAPDGKQPFAVNNHQGHSTLGRGLVVEQNRFNMPGGSFKMGVTNRASADVLSAHGTSNAIVRNNYIVGSGELGITFTLGGNENLIDSNYIDNADTGGISLGKRNDPRGFGNVVTNNIVRNGALDVRNEIRMKLGNYYFTRQDGLVLRNNRSFIDNRQVEYDYIYENCFNVDDQGSQTNRGAANDILYMLEQNTFVSGRPAYQ